MGRELSSQLSARPKIGQQVRIGWIEEVPGVNCQESTRAALIESLRITLGEALEFNRQEAIGAAGNDYEELPIAV